MHAEVGKGNIGTIIVKDMSRLRKNYVQMGMLREQLHRTNVKLIATNQLAMESDPYYGFVYALGADKNSIVYVELIVCNYFMDIDYESMIPEEYLPIGFDATKDNSYRKQKLGE